MKTMGEPVVIKHTTSGAVATVYPFGATVTSYVTSSGHETLFVSRLAKKDGSRAIRGGIPLVFPQFGQPNKDMPQHGFLRSNTWTVGSSYDNEDESGCEFILDLKDVVNARGDGKWAAGGKDGLDCCIRLLIKVSSISLTTTLIIQNTGILSFDYQTLFHTYYKVHGAKSLDKDLCNVSGLGGYSVEDKITGEKYLQPEDQVIFVDCEVDRIYTPPSEKSDINVVICTGDDGSKVEMHAYATADGKSVPVSAVVWNPFIEKAKGMGDFGDDQYHEMICVEPGILSGMKAIEASKEVIFTQVISPKE